ncbi:MAG: TolC family protein [Treponema sp.]|jgi:outer membrane protein TolC|nr:TolC family protein [Treponema sp.]
MKRNYHPVFLPVLLLTGFLFSGVPVHGQTILDVDTAVARALEHNLSLKRRGAEMAGAKRRMDHSWNSLVPSLTASGLLGRPTSLTGLEPGTAAWTPGVSVSASLPLSAVIVSSIGQTKKEYEAGLLGYEEARQNLEFQVRQFFYQLILLKDNVLLAEQNAETAQSRYEQTAGLVRIGQSSRLDELSARVDLENRKSNLRNAEVLYSNAADMVRQFLLIPPEETIVIKDGSFETGHINLDNGEQGEQARESWSIALLRNSLELLEIQRKGAATNACAPVLGVSWETSSLYRDSKWADNGQFSVTLSFKLDNLLPWSAARESIHFFDDQIESQRSLLRETILDREYRIRQLQTGIRQSLENIETLRLTVTLTEETCQTCEEVYRRGGADLQSLRQADDDLFLARNSVLEEEYNLACAVLELEKELNIPFGALWSGHEN